jgi:hypothetical protein
MGLLRVVPILIDGRNVISIPAVARGDVTIGTMSDILVGWGVLE